MIIVLLVLFVTAALALFAEKLIGWEGHRLIVAFLFAIILTAELAVGAAWVTSEPNFGKGDIG